VFTQFNFVQKIRKVIYLCYNKLSVNWTLISLNDIVSINLVTLLLENIGQFDHDIMILNTDKINNVSFKGLIIHYH
jgi:hypothetical protein